MASFSGDDPTSFSMPTSGRHLEAPPGTAAPEPVRFDNPAVAVIDPSRVAPPSPPAAGLSAESERSLGGMFEDPDIIDQRLAEHQFQSTAEDPGSIAGAGPAAAAGMHDGHTNPQQGDGIGVPAAAPTAGAGAHAVSSGGGPAADGRAFVLKQDVNWRELSHQKRRVNMLWQPFANAVVESEYRRYADVYPFAPTTIMMLVLSVTMTIGIMAMMPFYSMYNVTMGVMGLVCALCLFATIIGRFVLFRRGLRSLDRPEGMRRLHAAQALVLGIAGAAIGVSNAMTAGSCHGREEGDLCRRTPRVFFLTVILLTFIAIKNPVHFAGVTAFVVAVAVVGYGTVAESREAVDLTILIATTVFYGGCITFSHFYRDIATRTQFLELVRLAAAEQELSDQRTRIALIVRCAVPARVAARLANSATAHVPRNALIDEATKATICVTSATDFNQWSTGLLLTQIVSSLHHLYTVFDAATAVFGVDQGGTLGDEYVVTAGLVRGSPSTAAHAAFFALWQHNLREAQVVRLRSCLATGQLAGGVVGGSSIRYIVNGQALEVATRALALVESDMVWATDSTVAELAKRAPGLFAACPEVAAAGLYSLHPTSRAIDPDVSAVGQRDDDTATIKTAQVDESMQATKLWLSGHETAAKLTAERRSSAFILGMERLESLQTTGITVFRDEATGVSRVPDMVDFARVAVDKLRCEDDLNLSARNNPATSMSLSSGDAGARRGKVDRRGSDGRPEVWQQPHRPKVRPIAGVFEDAADEQAYREYTAMWIRRGSPSLFAAGVAVQAFMLVALFVERSLDDSVSPDFGSVRDVVAIVVCGLTIVFLGAASVWAARICNAEREAAAAAKAVAAAAEASGQPVEPVTPVPPPSLRIYLALGLAGCLMLALPIALVDRANVFNEPWFMLLALLAHMATGSARYLPWYQATGSFWLIFCLPAAVLAIVKHSVEKGITTAVIAVAAVVCSRLGSQRFREGFCVAYEVRAKAAAVQQSLVLLEQLARCLLPPHVVDLGLRSTDLEVRRQMQTGEAAAEPHVQLASVQRLVHHMEPTDRLADCVVVRALLEPGTVHQADTFFNRWAAVGELLRQATGGVLQQVETLGDTIILAGPFGALPGLGVFEAAYAAIGFLHALRHSLGLSFEAVCVIDEAYGSLLGRGMMRYALFGVAVRHASALLSSAPRRANTAVAYLNRTFVNWLVDEGRARRVPVPPPLPYGLQPRQRWRVRSVGLTYVWPLVFDAGPQPVVNPVTMLAQTPVYINSEGSAQDQPTATISYHNDYPLRSDALSRQSDAMTASSQQMIPVELQAAAANPTTSGSPVVVVQSGWHSNTAVTPEEHYAHEHVEGDSPSEAEERQNYQHFMQQQREHEQQQQQLQYAQQYQQYMQQQQQQQQQQAMYQDPTATVVAIDPSQHHHQGMVPVMVMDGGGNGQPQQYVQIQPQQQQQEMQPVYFYGGGGVAVQPTTAGQPQAAQPEAGMTEQQYHAQQQQLMMMMMGPNGELHPDHDGDEDDDEDGYGYPDGYADGYAGADDFDGEHGGDIRAALEAMRDDTPEPRSDPPVPGPVAADAPETSKKTDTDDAPTHSPKE